ncbi:Tol-Pal system beta propeller repeat protein TolB [Rhodoblastus acidophilus]|uniref:Tol-Pal system protein TolB n=1 Tax=Candidatus Rhodoblastus alkanivorans TaxID=2954117 RepID=A0ABS9Z2U3_9HYPH|nr:Tol-Pal system beta propeller repeat protein TolB [Candidatus Rhodoblastus alkanivorans]MCI4677564.1 Tol-Pal system beta propeller repeat protein TolB [Candidatus Rhodoblastus alkanivorans]MCI4681923.1 Tol-Pal system beta propeller repeat protein TolB [Candidatus Rhodoblastus alkanivorans]MDI4642973.1 Tol-Pal system beta propeller repeat protein TolB [Rhodoblastus acidophilus]
MQFTPSRRAAAAMLGGLALTPLFTRVSSGQRYLDVHGGGNFTPVNVAIVPFAGDGGASISAIIVNNFKRSVFINPIDAGAAGAGVNPDAAPNLATFKALGAQYVVVGRAGRGPDGRMKTEFRLWDVGAGTQASGQQYVTDPNNSRRVGHIISDAIFTKVTGESGFFDTRIAFVDETGSRQDRRKRLAIMDQDGANVRYLTRGEDLVVTPRFSPNSQELTYMSFGAEDPRVFLLNIDTGQREVVGNFPGMTFSPRFSPDGQRVVMSLEQNGSANLYSMDLRSRKTTRLTDSSAIDTSPCYSPDGSRICFESDRGGTQQIYVMSAGGGPANRISFGEGRYSTPVWSPKGDYIAFTRVANGKFAIGVIKPDGSGQRILVESFHNEGPTWAPNGLFVMFFRNVNGGPHLFMTDIFGRAQFPAPTPNFGSDPSWSALLG